MMASKSDDIVVIEIKGTYLYSLSEVFENASSNGRDNMLTRIPDIRAQLEKFEIHHEEDQGPPGYLRLSRHEAQQLADLLEHLDNPGRDWEEARNAASEIREQAEQAPGDPDVMTMYGTRFGWAQASPSSGKPHEILVEVQDDERLHQKGRFKNASISRNHNGKLNYRLEVATKWLNWTLKTAPVGEFAQFTVRIQPDGNLQLEHVELVNASQ